MTLKETFQAIAAAKPLIESPTFFESVENQLDGKNTLTISESAYGISYASFLEWIMPAMIHGGSCKIAVAEPFAYCAFIVFANVGQGGFRIVHGIDWPEHGCAIQTPYGLLYLFMNRQNQGDRMAVVDLDDLCCRETTGLISGLRHILL